MSTVPPHYSDRFVNKRFHKALYIVQHLSPSSSFQPTKDQKLELYALYKQAVSGNVNTPRPGIFDVVGRAKWDAWNKLDGLTSLEAKHRYVEALLRVAVEAFKKPASKVQAHQIIQAFTTMQPSADNETEDETSNDDGSSAASTDAEERDYLLEIQRDKQKMPTPYTQNRSNNAQLPVSPAFSRSSVSYRLKQPQQRRPPSVASTQSGQVSVRTAPTTRRPSTSSTTSKGQMDAARVGRPMIDEEPFDPHVNPWAPPQRYKIDDGRSMDEDNGRLMQLPSPVISANSMHYQQQHSISLRSSHHGSSAASSMTATPTTTRLPIDTSNNQLLTDQQYTSVVALGPATKRALDTLQAEIVALNERIDGLRQELTERNQSRRVSNNNNEQDDNEDDANSEVWEGWKWVAKAALRHALVNMTMAFILFVMLYQRGSPVAYIIIGQMNKFWKAARVRLLISKILV
ncbi:ACBP-domain-containing protein [Lichtheimia hyalospora FSU 10163]|nr:ACBP-domain-containing protein [Lichtheimia hyalospora FSU 10163]